MKRPWLKVFIGLAVLFAAVVLFFVVEHVRGKRAQARTEASLRAQGEKLSPAELVPPILVPVDPGWDRLSDAQSRLAANRLSDLAPRRSHFLAPGQVMNVIVRSHWLANATSRSPKERTNATWAPLEDMVREFATPLADARDALRQPLRPVRLNYEQGFAALFPHLVPFKRLGQTLAAAAAADLHAGRLDAAVDNIAAALVVARILREDRILISELVAAAVQAIILADTWQALQLNGWSDGQLAALQGHWQKTECVTTMTRALAMERGMVQSDFAIFRDSSARVHAGMTGGWGGPPGGLAGVTNVEEAVEYVSDNADEFLNRFLMIPLWQFAWSHQDQDRHLTLTQRLLEAMRQGAAQHSIAPLHTALTQVNIAMAADGPVGHMRHLISHIALPSCTNILERAFLRQTEAELTVTAIALKRFELKHGRPALDLPALLPEFLGDLPRDWFSGEPLRYRLREGGGYLLYSVGSDLRDDGGDASPLEKMANPTLPTGRDIVWPQAATDEQVRQFEEKSLKRK